jgi:hypothetical protein
MMIMMLMTTTTMMTIHPLRYAHNLDLQTSSGGAADQCG